jgi:hypothetical protein
VIVDCEDISPYCFFLAVIALLQPVVLRVVSSMARDTGLIPPHGQRREKGYDEYYDDVCCDGFPLEEIVAYYRTTLSSAVARCRKGTPDGIAVVEVLRKMQLTLRRTDECDLLTRRLLDVLTEDGVLLPAILNLAITVTQ